MKIVPIIFTKNVARKLQLEAKNLNRFLGNWWSSEKNVSAYCFWQAMSKK